MKTNTRILAYFDRYVSPKRERIIGFWFIIIPTVVLMLLSILFSSCSPEYTCTAVSGSGYNQKTVAHQIKRQSNYKLAARNNTKP